MNRDKLRQVSHGAVPDEPAFEGLTKRREEKHRRRRLRAAVVGIGLGALVVAGLATVLPRNGRNLPGSPTDGVYPSPVTIVESDKFFYRDLSFFLVDLRSGPFRMQTWSADDGSGRLVYVPPEKGGDDYGMPIEKDGYGQSDPADVVYQADEIPFVLIDLSSDPEEARTQLDHRSGSGGASPDPQPISGGSFGQSGEELKLMRVMQDLLTDDAGMIATPQSQQGLFGVMADLPNVSEVNSTTDPAGRPAIALVYDLRDYIPVFYFDPDTHLLLASAEFSEQGTAVDVRIVQQESYSDTRTIPDPKGSLIPVVTTAAATQGARDLRLPSSGPSPGGSQ